MNGRFSIMQTGLCMVLVVSRLAAGGVPEDLKDHLNQGVTVCLDVYPQKPKNSVVPEGFIQDSPINTVFKYGWQTWSDLTGRTRLDTSGWFEYGLPYDHRWRGGIDFLQDDQNLSRPLVINELYTTTRLGPVDLVVGRTIRRNTKAILYPLADRYVARDFNDPLHAKLLGTWQARLDAFAGDWECSVAVLPVFQPHKVPGIESRWWLRDIEPLTGVPYPNGANGKIDSNTPDVSAENTAGLISMKLHRARWDFFATFYDGLASHAVTRLNQPTPNDYFVELDYVRGFEASAGLSTSIGVFELHSETLYHRTHSDEDDEYIAGLIGCLWQIDRLADAMEINQVHLTTEYAREHILSEQDASLGYAASSKPFRFGRDTLFTECLFDISDKNSVALGMVLDFDGQNVFSRLRAGHRFGNGSRIDVILDLFGGDALYFGAWNRNDRLSVNYDKQF